MRKHSQLTQATLIVALSLVAGMTMAAAHRSRESFHAEVDFDKGCLPRVRQGVTLEVESGASIDIESGGSHKVAGTAVTPTAAEFNELDQDNWTLATNPPSTAVSVHSMADDILVTITLSAQPLIWTGWGPGSNEYASAKIAVMEDAGIYGFELAGYNLAVAATNAMVKMTNNITYSVGTAAASAVALTSTMANLVPTNTPTTNAKGITNIVHQYLVTDFILDASSAAPSIYLNSVLSNPAAARSSAVTGTVSGTVWVKGCRGFDY